MPSADTLRLVLVVVLAVTAGCSFFGPQPDSYTSSYEYTVAIDANETVENATIRVPMAQVGGEPVFGNDTIAPNGSLAVTTDTAARGTNRSAIASINASVVATRQGPMLELTMDEFAVQTRYFRTVENETMGRIEEINRSEYDPDNRSHDRRTRRTVAATFVLDASYPIETREPVGTSPTLYADGVTRSLTDCDVPVGDQATCFDYRGPVALDYRTASNASVDVTARFTGSNEWFSAGWTGNSYDDTVRVRARGPQSGTVSATGETRTGQGRYPAPEP